MGNENSIFSCVVPLSSLNHYNINSDYIIDIFRSDVYDEQNKEFINSHRQDETKYNNEENSDETKYNNEKNSDETKYNNEEDSGDLLDIYTQIMNSSIQEEKLKNCVLKNFKNENFFEASIYAQDYVKEALYQNHSWIWILENIDSMCEDSIKAKGFIWWSNQAAIITIGMINDERRKDAVKHKDSLIRIINKYLL